MNFYATAAVVIPVFFLAMAFQSGALMRLPTSYDPGRDPKDARQWNGSQIIGILFVALLMVCGEFAALVGVYLNRSSGLLNGLTWLGVVAGLAGVALPILAYQWRLLGRHLKAVQWDGSVLFVLGFVLFTLLATTAIVLGLFVS